LLAEGTGVRKLNEPPVSKGIDSSPGRLWKLAALGVSFPVTCSEGGIPPANFCTTPVHSLLGSPTAHHKGCCERGVDRGGRPLAYMLRGRTCADAFGDRE